MPIDCRVLIDSYLAWLRERISVEKVNGACQITTPFLDRHNDRLQIYVVPHNGGFRLTDDGYIIADLESSGCVLDTPSRKQLLQVVLNGFGVHEDHGELFVEASEANFPQKKHAIVQAMLAVNDMFMASKHRVATLFLEDVSRFLDSHDVRYSPHVEFTGKTGFVHKFDFLIPKSRKAPERLIRAINLPSRQNATSALFAWTDTKEVRSPNSKFVVILNDSEQHLSSDLTSAFEGYGVSVVPWSARDKHAQQLAA
jgi:Domain of unknown function DUF1829/Domain of unknown function DUF1828